MTVTAQEWLEMCIRKINSLKPCRNKVLFQNILYTLLKLKVFFGEEQMYYLKYKDYLKKDKEFFKYYEYD